MKAPQKEYLRLLKAIYDLRKVGYVTWHTISSYTNKPIGPIYAAVCNIFEKKKWVHPVGRNPKRWCITPVGINYLFVKGIISLEEKEKSTKELEESIQF